MIFSNIGPLTYYLFTCLGAFMDAISSMGFDFVASGHYAKVIHEFTEQSSGPSVLQLSEDMVYLNICLYEK